MNNSPVPWTSFLVIAATVMVALLTWPIAGTNAAWGVLLTGLAGLLGYHLIQLHRLLVWLGEPSISTLPDGMGAWGRVYTALYHRERQLARSQLRLEGALDRFQSAGDAIPDGIILLDERERIEWFNPSAQHFIELNPEQDIGQQLQYLVRNPQFVEYLQMDTPDHPLVFRPRHNSDTTLSVQSVPFDSTRKMLIIRDITLLERANTTRRDFVANVSHELRTPLTVIGGFLETLEEMHDDNPQLFKRYQPLMLEQTNRMQRLISDLLTLSRLEGEVVVTETTVDVPRLVMMLKTEAEGLSQGRHTILMNIDSNDGLKGNQDQLHSAFGNLVSNAIRYTPEGGTIHLKWQTNATGATFAVEDTGIGVAPEDIPRLTERFYRVDRGRSRSTGGTGLGLAIVKHVLIHHQAKLDISSANQKGSRFACCFPAARIQSLPSNPVVSVTP